jgi:hypothetical protein
MGALKVSVDDADPQRLRVQLSGAIDEQTDIAAVLGALRAPVVVLNLRGIERINSVGVHRWIPAMRALAEGRRVVVEEVSYAVATQANYVANLLTPAVVTSCLAPYYCPSCDQPATVVVTSSEVAGAAGPPERRCDRCHDRMEFDELDDYFTFLRR